MPPNVCLRPSPRRGDKSSTSRAKYPPHQPNPRTDGRVVLSVEWTRHARYAVVAQSAVNKLKTGRVQLDRRLHRPNYLADPRPGRAVVHHRSADPRPQNRDRRHRSPNPTPHKRRAAPTITWPNPPAEPRPGQPHHQGVGRAPFFFRPSSARAYSITATSRRPKSVAPQPFKPVRRVRSVSVRGPDRATHAPPGSAGQVTFSPLSRARPRRYAPASPGRKPCCARCRLCGVARPPSAASRTRSANRRNPSPHRTEHHHDRHNPITGPPTTTTPPATPR